MSRDRQRRLSSLAGNRLSIPEQKPCIVELRIEIAAGVAMPSPFPGMDPFLDAPGVFPDLHDRLIGGISDAINGELLRPYYSIIASRVLVELSDRRIGPDVGVVFTSDKSSSSVDGTGGGAVAISTIEVQPIVIHVPYDESRT